jgi:hypothetical protein
MGDIGYHIAEIHYRDIYGNLLWKDPMIFSRLHAVGEDFVNDYVKYVVRRVAVADDVQHVNVEVVS